MPEDHRIVQFVCFETSLPREVFLSRWEPFVASFLAKGIERVVLGEGDGTVGFGFVSRNIWPELRFGSVFQGNLPGDAGGGAVTAVHRFSASSRTLPRVRSASPSIRCSTSIR